MHEDLQKRLSGSRANLLESLEEVISAGFLCVCPTNKRMCTKALSVRQCDGVTVVFCEMAGQEIPATVSKGCRKGQFVPIPN